MENASKALIMAGAVLIAIILISIGVYIISSQKGTIDSSKRLSDTMAIQTYNDSFTKYAGTQKGSVVKDLLDTIQTNNNSKGRKTVITVSYDIYSGSDVDTISGIKSNIIPAKSYKVDVAGYDANGYVTEIKISNP